MNGYSTSNLPATPVSERKPAKPGLLEECVQGLHAVPLAHLFGPRGRGLGDHSLLLLREQVLGHGLPQEPEDVVEPLLPQIGSAHCELTEGVGFWFESNVGRREGEKSVSGHAVQALHTHSVRAVVR